MSEIRVTNVIGENGNSPVNFTKGINMSGICTAPAFVPSQGQLSHRNLVINGAMMVAQRGTSSTTSGYGTVDRFILGHTGTDEAPTQSQVDVASGTTPYSLGFRKAFRVTNGNQTSGAGAADAIQYTYKFEAQDIANSGWNYTSSSSYVTLSFWCKSSVAQEFHGFLLTNDGSAQLYSFSTGSLSADTWTKVTKTIPGNSNLTFNSDNGEGINMRISQYQGTNYTGSITENQWAAFNTSIRNPDMTSTWYTTNDATFELTGMQLEVGPVATPFEHRSRGDELARCQRYFYKWVSSQAYSNMCLAYAGSSTQVETVFNLPVVMRASPSFAFSGQFRFVGYSPQNSTNLSNLVVHRSHTLTPYLRGTVSGSASGLVGELGDSGSNNATASFSAEL
tara:strand:- start:629 stop:1807 length:1179 start_codon:yes stop_codon:yes gene_type:complete